jgi:hypothetical protein
VAAAPAVAILSTSRVVLRWRPQGQRADGFFPRGDIAIFGGDWSRLGSAARFFAVTHRPATTGFPLAPRLLFVAIIPQIVVVIIVPQITVVPQITIVTVTAFAPRGTFTLVAAFCSDGAFTAFRSFTPFRTYGSFGTAASRTFFATGGGAGFFSVVADMPHTTWGGGGFIVIETNRTIVSGRVVIIGLVVDFGFAVHWRSTG